MKPDFDLIVYGATGYTGRLIAEYLATSYRGARLRFPCSLLAAAVLQILGRPSIKDDQNEPNVWMKAR